MTLAQHWYDIKLALCSAFPGLDPVRLLDYPLVDVLDLIREHLDHNRRDRQRLQKIDRPQPRDSGREKVIYRQADDTWF